MRPVVAGYLGSLGVNMHRPNPPWKRIVIEQLEELASEDVQLTYENNVPIANVPSEMLLWFDVAYHPDDSNVRSCFNGNELAALAAFNEYFDLCIHKLPEANYSIRTWFASSIWREIMDKARQAREHISA